MTPKRLFLERGFATLVYGGVFVQVLRAGLYALAAWALPPN
jgi:hypothetical protein